MTDRHHAYTSLLMRHRKMLWRLCWQRADGDREGCQDLMQEVSIALWENFEKLRPDAAPGEERAWVCWQARSVFYQLERQQKLSTVPLDEAIADSLAADESAHRKELLDDLLAALNADERRMVELYLQGYQGDEIGETIGVRRDAVYQRMRRVIRKLRRLALILIALLFTSAIAVAVVPQWRHYVFGGHKAPETAVDTMPEPQAPARSASTPATPDSLPPAVAAKREPFQKPPLLEKLPPMDPLDLLDIPAVVPPQPLPSKPSVRLDGSRLIITGADGQLVRVYDCSGKLVAAQTASFMCTIDLFPSTAILETWRRYEFVLYIGDFPPMDLNLIQ